jgi:signal transduction histidine kinase
MEDGGGSVRAESEAGKGTSIILTFPARKIV